MPIVAKVIIPGKVAENVLTPQYTAVNVTTIIDKFTAMNDSGATATISVSLGVGAAERVVKNKSLTPGQTYTFPEIVGHVLTIGTSLSTQASAVGAINIRSSGREIS